MNTKITLPDLIAALSQSSGQPRNVCERFIKVMFTTVSETLVAGENVKIKGLGTFKVSDVEERKSVNVNTGAEMIIPGHRKVSFNPDKNLAELINAPFALFEPVELDDEVSEEMLNRAEEEPQGTHTAIRLEEKPVAEQSSEDIKAEIADTTIPVPEAPKDSFEEAVEEQFSEPEAPEMKLDEHETVISAPALEVTVTEESHSEESATEAQPDSTAEEHDEVVMETKAAPRSIDTVIEEDTDDKHKKVEIHVHSPECHAPHFRKGIYIGIAAAVVCMVLLLAAWRILLPTSFCTVTDTLLPQSQSELIAQQARPATPVADTAAVTPDSLPKEERIEPIKETEAETIDVAPTEVSDKTEKKDKEAAPAPAKVYDTITKNRFLTTMAKEHYGDYNLWPYIYDENKAILGHPDRIKPGTKVVIPPASKYGIDAGNPECIAKAKRRGAAIYAKYKK